MKRIRTGRPGFRRERSWPQGLPADPRNPDVVRAKAPVMKNRMAPDISLAIVLFAAVATVALRAAARRQEPPPVPGTELPPATVRADESRPRTAVTAGTQDGAGHEMARPPGPLGRPASVVEQMQHVFHELHADGRNALCAVCDGQYGPA